MYIHSNHRWGYGQIPILLVVTSAPLLGGLWHVQNKAKKAGLIKKYEEEHKTDEPKKTIGERLIWLANEIDIIGCLLFVGFLTLVLLPLVLALTAWGGWGSPITIGTICGGVVCGILFCIWEWKYAVKPVIPLGKWEDKTPIYGVLALSTVTIISATNWQFFNTYLVISRKISVTKAMYLGRGYNVAYVVFQLVSGYLMKRTRKWRPLVWAGVSMLILGVGLMIPARLPTSSDAFVVISETIAGMGSGKCFFFFFCRIILLIK